MKVQQNNGCILYMFIVIGSILSALAITCREYCARHKLQY